jgi:hypothetical protein
MPLETRTDIDKQETDKVTWSKKDPTVKTAKGWERWWQKSRKTNSSRMQEKHTRGRPGDMDMIVLMGGHSEEEDWRQTTQNVHQKKYKQKTPRNINSWHW